MNDRDNHVKSNLKQCTVDVTDGRTDARYSICTWISLVGRGLGSNDGENM